MSDPKHDDAKQHEPTPLREDDPAREKGVKNSVDEAAYESFPASDPPSFTRPPASEDTAHDEGVKDAVDEAVDQSFPASDPPSFTPREDDGEDDTDDKA